MKNIISNKKIVKINKSKYLILKNNIKLLIKSWQFWFKLIIGILPIISIIVFTSVSLYLTLLYKHKGIFPKNWSPKYETTLQELQSWSDFSVILMVIFRNLTLYTSYSTFIFSSFFINFAFNSLRKKHKKYINNNSGIFTMVIISFTLFFYNLSLPITKDFKTWSSIQWMSMFLQHSLIPLLGVIYYFIYNYHYNLVYNKKRMLVWWMYSLVAILGYFLIFTILGYILKITNSWKPMPDMSFSGYFPYDFMEFTNPKANYTNGKITMFGQTFTIYTVFILIITIYYFGFYFIQIKICYKKNK